MAKEKASRPAGGNASGDSSGSEFARQASGRSTGVLGEFWLFLRTNKKWWLTPIIVVLLLVALLIVLGGTGAAPFIYTLF